MEMTKPGREREELEGALLPPSPFSAEREREELYGALLPPPVPTAPPPGKNDVEETAIPIAVPVTNNSFDRNMPTSQMTFAESARLPPATVYQQRPPHRNADAENSRVRSDLPIQGYPETVTTSLLPAAHALRAHDALAPSSQQIAVSTQLRYAQRRAKIASEEERDGIARAQRERNATRYHNGAAVRAANREALRRDAEGLDVEDTSADLEEAAAPTTTTTEVEWKSDARDSDAMPYATERAEGQGYEVAEYGVSDYDVADYKVTEYKSVYD